MEELNRPLRFGQAKKLTANTGCTIGVNINSCHGLTMTYILNEAINREFLGMKNWQFTIRHVFVSNLSNIQLDIRLSKQIFRTKKSVLSANM